MNLAPVPSLDELASDPTKAAGLSPDVARALTLRCAAVLTALAAVGGPANAPAREPPADDHLLTADEAAARLGTSPRWLRRHAGRLPFARRLSRKTLRYSEAGLTRWLAARKLAIPKDSG